jgi:hypothetical protein
MTLCKNSSRKSKIYLTTGGEGISVVWLCCKKISTICCQSFQAVGRTRSITTGWLGANLASLFMLMAKKINWREIRRRESFFLKRGYFPKGKQDAKKRPVIFYGMNTVK